jgi:hypothetical protein
MCRGAGSRTQPRASRVSTMPFVVRPGLALSFAAPATSSGRGGQAPPSRRGYGDYCLRATCPLLRGGELVGTFTGFDTHPGVADATLKACRLRSTLLDGGADAYVCGPDPSVVFVPHTTTQCSGQIYFSMGTTTVRVK